MVARSVAWLLDADFATAISHSVEGVAHEVQTVTTSAGANDLSGSFTLRFDHCR